MENDWRRENRGGGGGRDIPRQPQRNGTHVRVSPFTFSQRGPRDRASTCCPSCWHAPAGAVLIRDEKRGQDVVEAVPARRAPRRFLGGCPWQIER